SSGHLTNGQAGVLSKAGQPASEVFAREDPIRIGRVGARLPCSTHRSSPGTLTGYLSVRSTGRTAIANPRTAPYGSSRVGRLATELIKPAWARYVIALRRSPHVRSASSPKMTRESPIGTSPGSSPAPGNVSSRLVVACNFE